MSMMKKYAKKIMSSDNVATCVADVREGDTLFVKNEVGEEAYKAAGDIEFGHKIALRDIPKGEYIYKYGQKIGKATREIKTGEWVHTHNVADHYEVK